MAILEALKSLMDGVAQAAYRKSWNDDPTTKGTVVIYHPNKFGNFHYWYTSANPPDYPWPWEDDARVGPPIEVFSLTDILAEDWEVMNL